MTRLTQDVKELLAKIHAADAVRINGQLYVITNKSCFTDEKEIELYGKIEDFEVIFETDYHTFNWWELSCETKKLNEREWKVGDSEVLCFLTVIAV